MHTSYTQMFLAITAIDFSYQNVGMACAKVGSDVHGYHWHLFV